MVHVDHVLALLCLALFGPVPSVDGRGTFTYLSKLLALTFPDQMGDSVERALEETIPILNAAKRTRLLNSQEIAEVVRKRRHHEYSLTRKEATRSDFLKYASFERELAVLLKKRADKRGIKKKKVELVVGKTASRVNLVYSRAVKRFRNDVDLWLHYARHCIFSGSTRSAGKVFANAIAFRSDSARLWLAAIAFHFDKCGDAGGARSLAQRALRAMPDSVVMWQEYFRVEVCYLVKLIARRLTIGLSASGPRPSVKNPKESNSQKKGKKSESVGELLFVDKNAEAHAADIGITNLSDHDDEVDSDAEHISASDGADSAINKDEKASAEDDGDASSKESSTFWNGGVPMAVLRKACSRVVLSEQDRIQFYAIASESPYVPSTFLSAMVAFLREKYPECCVTRLIEIRLSWDSLHVEYRREADRAIDKDAENEENKAGKSQEKKKEKEIRNESGRVVDRMGSYLDGLDLSNQDGSTKTAVLDCLNGYRDALKKAPKYGKVGDISALISRAEAELEMSREEIGLGESEKLTDETGELPPERWSLKEFERLICGDDKGEEVLDISDELYEVLKNNVLIPFRGIIAEKIIHMYLSREKSVERVREFSNFMITIPPFTMQSLRAAIDAELRFQNELLKDNNELSQKGSEQMIVQSRKLFKAASSVSAAERDVDFWLTYIDFERRIASNSKESTMVSWKALKVLKRDLHEVFTERQTLRNLS